MAQFIGWGDGHDGSVSSATGVINTYAAMTGSAGGTTVTTNLSVNVGDMVMLHQSRGTANVGKWELVKVVAVGSGQFTADRNLVNTYASVSQAVLIPQYSAGTCSNSLTASIWDGTTKGIIALCVNGAFTLTGSISVNNCGYDGTYYTGSNNGKQGEGSAGAGGTISTAANGSGGGGGDGGIDQSGGGGGGNGTAGTTGGTYGGSYPGGTGGEATGNSALTVMTFGGGGGTGGLKDSGTGTSYGGDGGGIVLIIAKQFTLSGTISSNGQAGSNIVINSAAGGGGAGGSILIKAQTATLGNNLITATAGAGGTGSGAGVGGAGGAGRIHLDYLSSYTGTTNPTLDVAQDKSLSIKGGVFIYNLL